MKVNFAPALAFFLILIEIVGGCAQKISTEKTMAVSPVSPAETRLIQIRTASENIHPYEQIELGQSLTEENHFVLKGEPNPDVVNPDIANKNIANKDIEQLVNSLWTARRLATAYFGNFPGDLALYHRIESTLSEDHCFQDGQDTYCGPGLLTAAFFLITSEETLHEWLNAIDNSILLSQSRNSNQMPKQMPEKMPKKVQRSAVFLDFVRYFVFGSYPSFAASHPIYTVENCRIAHERLASEFPNEWEMNPCRLTLSHQAQGHKWQTKQKFDNSQSLR